MPRRPHPQERPKKPLGQPTRGKTMPNRLRRVDAFVLRYDPGLIARPGPALAVDLGYGAEPFTTLEMAQRLRRLNPHLPVLGVEIDPQRVAVAQPYADALTSFRLGGFNVPLLPGESIRLMRAFNVLRQYEESQVAAAWAQMAAGVQPGGLLVEGTSTPSGALWSANLLRRTADGWQLEALVFSTNFRLGFDPAEFQTILPKNLIHRVTPGEPIEAFFAAWKRAADQAGAQRVWGLRPWFIASAEGLRQQGYTVNLRRGWLNRGWLIWERPALES